MNARTARFLEMATTAPTAMERVEACSKLIRAGLFDEAESALAGLREDDAVGREARKLLAICRQLRRWGIIGKLESYAEAMGSENRVDFDDKTGCLLARRSEASKVLFVFTGNALQIWLSLHLLHQLLPEDCHIVYLKDHRKAGYLFGINELGGNYRETVSEMRRMVVALGAARVYCLGSSGGGYASLRYGLDLDAIAVLAFSPATDCSLANIGGAARVFADVSAGVATDIKTLFAAAPHAPWTKLVYGENSEGDAAACTRLVDLPMVSLLPVPHYSGHDSIAPLIASGEFRPLIDEFLATGCPYVADAEDSANNLSHSDGDADLTRRARSQPPLPYAS